MNTALLTFLGGLISLAILIFKWSTDKTFKIDKKKDDAKKEIKEAIDTGDVSRIHAIIERLYNK